MSTSLTNAAINHNKDSVMLTILSNDNPFGTFMFENRTSIHVKEIENPNHVMVSLIRIGGSIGDVQVHYR